MPKVDFTNIYKTINPVYRRYLKDHRPYQVFLGGGSAGKSYFVAQKIIYNLINLPGYNVLALRKIAASNHDSTFGELCKCINNYGFTELFKINESKGDEKIIFQGNGNQILFKGLKDKKELEKVKSVTFPTGPLVCIWLEEATEFTENDLNQMEIRIRGLSDIRKHIIISFNPIDVDHWIKARFFDNPIPTDKGFSLKTTYLDNKFLTTDDRERLEKFKTIDQYYYNVYCLGNWGSISNARLFHNIKIWDFDFVEHDYEDIRHGLDFGFVHAQALMGMGYREGELYIHKEFWEKGADNLSFLKNVEASNFPKEYAIIADSANPGDILTWNNNGFSVYGARKGPGSLKLGIEYLRTLPVINIHATNCPHAAVEFPKFKRREFPDGTISEYEYVEVNDDTIAATRYAQEEFFITGRDMKRGAVFNKGAY